MTKLVTSCVVLGVMLGASGTAAAEPAYCQSITDRIMHTNVKDAINSEDPRWAVFHIIGTTCNVRAGTEEAQRQREIEASRERWSKRLGMTPPDWKDAAEWASEQQYKRMNTSIDYDRKKAWSTLTPIEQFAAIEKANDEATYVADALGPKLSEVGRFAYILHCFGSNQQIVDWAMCQSDIDVFDRAKFAAEIRASTSSSGYERMALRIALDGYDAQLKAHQAKVKETLAKDQAYQKVFEAAASGRKIWSNTDAALADLAIAMDDARITNSRRAFEGCHDKTWPAFKKAVSAIPAKKFAAVNHEPGSTSPLEQAAGVIVSDPNGYLAALSYFNCTLGGSKKDYLARALGSSMERWPGYRGPRMAALSAIMGAGIELDDRDARLEFPGVHHAWMGVNMSSGGGGRGVIASVKPSGKTAVIAFAKKLEQQQQCTNWKSSRKIVQIRSDGTLVYETWCTASKKVTVNTASPPQTVNVQYTAGLKPGMVVNVVEDVVTFGWAKNGAKEPSFIAGATVK